jgi:hypothetical protein
MFSILGGLTQRHPPCGIHTDVHGACPAFAAGCGLDSLATDVAAMVERRMPAKHAGLAR